MKKMFYFVLLVVFAFAMVACEADLDVSEQDLQTDESEGDVGELTDDEGDSSTTEQTEEHVTCPECGAEVPADEDYCPECGAPLYEETDEETDEEEEDSENYEEFQRTLQDTPEYHVEYELSQINEEVVGIYTKDENTRLDIETNGDTATAWMNGESVVEYEGQCVDLGTASQFGYDPESIYEKTTVEGTLRSEDVYLDVSSIGTESIAGKTTECF